MLSGPEVFRPLPVKVSSALGLWALHYLWWRDLALRASLVAWGAWVSPSVPGMLVWHV